MRAIRGRRADIASQLPVLYEGELAWAEDEGVLYIVIRNLAGTKELHQASAGVYIANTAPAIQGALAPTPAEIGQVWWDIVNQSLHIWDGAQWRGIGDDAPTVIGSTLPAAPVDRQFFLDVSNALQPRLFLYRGGMVRQWYEIKPPLASATDDGLLSQADFIRLQGLKNAAIPDWQAGPGVAGEILNKPVIPPAPVHATDQIYGLVVFAQDADLNDPNCRDKVVVAAQVAWLKGSLDWWRSTWLPGNHLSCGKEDVAIWGGKDDVLEVLGPIEINVDDRGWSVGPEVVRTGMTVEARWLPSAIARVNNGELINGSIVAAAENIRRDYDHVVVREMFIATPLPVISAPLLKVVTSGPFAVNGTNAPYLIWAASESPQAEMRIDGGDWMPVGTGPIVHGCGEAVIEVRHLTRGAVADDVKTWVMAGTITQNVMAAFHSITVTQLAPRLKRARLIERQPGGARFTGQSFDLEATLSVSGVPAARRLTRYEVMGRVDRGVQSAAITTAGITAGTAVRVSASLTQQPRSNAPFPYPKMLANAAPKELEDPANSRYYVPTGLPGSHFHDYRLNKDSVPMAKSGGQFYAYLLDFGAQARPFVALPWNRSNWDLAGSLDALPGGGSGIETATLRVYRYNGGSWVKDIEEKGLGKGHDHSYRLTQAAQYVIVAVEADGLADSMPPYFRIDSAPEVRLTFASNQDLANFQVGDSVKQDNALLSINVPIRPRIPSLGGMFANGLQSTQDLPASNIYQGLQSTVKDLLQLSAIGGYENVWMRYQSTSATPGVIGFVAEAGSGVGLDAAPASDTSKVYVTVKEAGTPWRVIEHHEVQVAIRGSAHGGRDPANISVVQIKNLPVDGLITLSAPRLTKIHVLFFGGIGSQFGPLGTVTAVNPAARTMDLEAVVGQFAVGRTVIGPRRVVEDLHRWLDVDAHGTVRGLLLEPPAWKEQVFTSDLATVRFPAVWDSGKAPDVDLPPGIELGAQVRAVNTAGSDELAAEPITPGAVATLQAGVAQASFDAYDQARLAAQGAGLARLQSLGFSAVDLAALHLAL